VSVAPLLFLLVLEIAGVAVIFLIIVQRAIKRQREQDAAMNAAPGDSWPCPICREQIPKGAKKCIKCRSELRWRRYLVFGTTTLALITALISVIVSSAPAIKSLFETKDSDIQGVFVSALSGSASGGSVNGRLTLLINNGGAKVGAVTGGRLQVAWGPDKIKSLSLQLTTPDHLPVFIAARDAKPAMMDILSEFSEKVADEDVQECVTKLKSLPPPYLGRSSNDEKSLEEADVNCWIWLYVTNASGKYDDTLFPATCQDLAPSILGAIEIERSRHPK
jgi:hypothetical protein